jgi:Rrf2 family protein
MQLTAKIEYAYKAILELAFRYDGEKPIRIGIVSQAQGIPKKFLVQLLLRLKNAGIVNSSRGVEGGYYLARHPSQFSLADIVKAVDDNLLNPPKRGKTQKLSSSERLILSIWKDLNNETESRLKGMSLDKLVSQIKSEPLNYYI